jgi:hypothetical protein
MVACDKQKTALVCFWSVNYHSCFSWPGKGTWPAVSKPSSRPRKALVWYFHSKNTLMQFLLFYCWPKPYVFLLKIYFLSTNLKDFHRIAHLDVLVLTEGSKKFLAYNFLKKMPELTLRDHSKRVEESPRYRASNSGWCWNHTGPQWHPTAVMHNAQWANAQNLANMPVDQHQPVLVVSIANGCDLWHQFLHAWILL